MAVSTKVRGKLVGGLGSFQVYINHKKPKTKLGKERVWVSIRQRGWDWRQAEAMIYVHGADVQFEKVAPVKSQSR